MSYNGRIDFGLVADYDALPDLDDVAAGLEAAIAELADGRRRGARAGRAGGARRSSALDRISADGRPLAPLTLALAQIDPRVGDLDGNARARCATTSRAPATPAPSWCCSPSWC